MASILTYLNEFSPALTELQKLLAPFFLAYQWLFLKKKNHLVIVVFCTDLVIAIHRSYLQSIWNRGRLWNLKKYKKNESFGKETRNKKKPSTIFTEMWLPCWNWAQIHLEGTKTFWKYWRYFFCLNFNVFCHLTFLISSSSTSRWCLMSSEEEGVWRRSRLFHLKKERAPNTLCLCLCVCVSLCLDPWRRLRLFHFQRREHQILTFRITCSKLISFFLGLDTATSSVTAGLSNRFMKLSEILPGSKALKPAMCGA